MMYTKASNPKNQAALEQFLLPLEMSEYDSKAAYECGVIRAKLAQNDKPIGLLDTFIAAHAKSLDLVLVTNNVREFSGTPELKIEQSIYKMHYCNANLFSFSQNAN